MKIVTVLGARPQFIKAATVSSVIQSRTDIQEVIVHTGQHYDQNMSDIFFDQMQIPQPNYKLQIASKYHGEMTGKMLEAIERILLDESPEIVLVYGDTNSTLAGALAAGKMNIPIAHVEAGLRSFNRRMPEEVNRVLTDHLATWLFAPTSAAVDNLAKEGISANSTFLVGDVMYDAILSFGNISKRNSTIVEDLSLVKDDFVLATIHRAENTNDMSRLHSIISDLNRLALERPVIFPVHPRTKDKLSNFQIENNIRLIDPVGYLDMIALQMNCRLVVTDSGGVQKEAFFSGKYCITVREQTEWVELVENGYNLLCPAGQSITDLVNHLWNKPFDKSNYCPYGDGKTAEKIVDHLVDAIARQKPQSV